MRTGERWFKFRVFLDGYYVGDEVKPLLLKGKEYENFSDWRANLDAFNTNTRFDRWFSYRYIVGNKHEFIVGATTPDKFLEKLLSEITGTCIIAFRDNLGRVFKTVRLLSTNLTE